MRKTRLTAALGYAMALDPDAFRDLFHIAGRISAITLANQLDDGHSDIHIDTSDGTELHGRAGELAGRVATSADWVANDAQLLRDGLDQLFQAIAGEIVWQVFAVVVPLPNEPAAPATPNPPTEAEPQMPSSSNAAERPAESAEPRWSIVSPHALHRVPWPTSAMGTSVRSRTSYSPRSSTKQLRRNHAPSRSMTPTVYLVCAIGIAHLEIRPTHLH